ncbi:MAG: universal stress protein [Desulfobacteraceae bacterium]|nr:MAG: universal stress protein [Desulfobacteraceae bacterium]
MAFNDSSSASSALEYMARIFTCPEDCTVTLLHLLRKPTGSEELMGKKYMQNVPGRMKQVMETARQKLLGAGFRPERITLRLVETPYATLAEGIIDQFAQGDYNLVVIGRKRMSKAEEFVLGDTSIRLVRALEGTAVMVVKE